MAKQDIDDKTIDIFGFQGALPSIEELVERAMLSIGSLYESGHPVVVAFSGGKDSSVVGALTLNAAAQAARQGLKPFVIFTTGDTMVENPEVTQHYRQELKKAADFAAKNGFKFISRVVRPSLASSFQMKILSGRGLPSYAGQSTDCTQDLKINAQRSFRGKLFKKLRATTPNEPVTLLGTRFQESERRAMHMKARGERADVPVRNKDGELVLSPIATWSTEDVWEFAGMVSSGIWEAFTDFAETSRIYAHSAGTSCAVVADAIYEGGKKQRKGGCGTRTGCFVCQQSEDKSLENLVAFDPRYEYAAGLVKLNKFIRAIRYDWTRRHWVGRTIKAGYIAIEPDTFHPSTIRELTRYMLQLDHDEGERARWAGEAPKFRILPEDMMVAIDAIQSLNGVAAPFQIWKDWDDIVNRGVRYDIPEIEPVAKTPPPAARYLFVGEEWDTTADGWGLTGLRDPYVESLTEMSGCSPKLVQLPNGRMAMEADTDISMSVDQDSVEMIMEFEVDRLIKMHDNGFFPGGITSGYMWYFHFGVLTLSYGQQSEHDEIARRTAYKDRLGLTLNYDVSDLLSKCINYAQLPPLAREAWSHKATTDVAQTDFFSELDESIEELALA